LRSILIGSGSAEQSTIFTAFQQVIPGIKHRAKVVSFKFLEKALDATAQCLLSCPLPLPTEDSFLNLEL
jgi:hypothetical protein